MAASNCCGTGAGHEEQAQLRAIEERHIDGGATASDENRQFFRGDLERAVDVITADRDRWVDTMLAEEYGLPRAVRSPLKAAASTFASFVLCGAVPLLPFLVGAPASFQLSIVMTALVFFLIGSTKSHWSPTSWWHSGSETLVIGLGAAALAFLVSHALKSLV
jgi:VIT1/CCC1 family predicted Fe2+/Mn2+ transporter